MSLNPNKNKKKKPTRLEPIDDTKPKHKPKITGNYASEVLAELEQREKNKSYSVAIRNLNKEMKGIMAGLQVDSNDIASQITQVNQAFGAAPSKVPDKKKQKKKKIDMTKDYGLVPILEEPKTGLELAVYKPDMSLDEQRKAKNAALKAKVKMLT